MIKLEWPRSSLTWSRGTQARTNLSRSPSGVPRRRRGLPRRCDRGPRLPAPLAPPRPAAARTEAGAAPQAGYNSIVQFLQSALANFLGSLFAGAILSALLYYFVTRRIEVLKPAAEHKAEQQVMLGMLAKELEECAQMCAALREARGEPAFSPELPRHAWDAARESGLCRFLPLMAISAVFDAYWQVTRFNRVVVRLEDAGVAGWTGGESGVGAEAFYRNLLAKLPEAAGKVGAACLKAQNLVKAEIKS